LIGWFELVIDSVRGKQYRDSSICICSENIGVFKKMFQQSQVLNEG